MRNMPLGRLPAACSRAPAGPVCERFGVAALDAAHRRLGLRRYLLPLGFARLRLPRQWLILANLDRIDASLVPIVGIAHPLDLIAREGARSGNDPNPWHFLRRLRTVAAIGYTAAWAGGLPTAVLAYYDWMYDDGYGGPNLDCRHPLAAACWGHRRVILSFPQGGTIAMGGAARTRASSFALTIVDTSAPVFTYTYTWARARAAGAASAR